MKIRANLDPRKYTKRLKDEAKKKAFLQTRKSNVTGEIEKRVENTLNRRVKENRVIQGLRDRGSNDGSDLGAEMGIISGAEDQLEHALFESNTSRDNYSVKVVRTTPGNTSNVVEIRLTVRTPPKNVLKTLDGYSDIPWMTIILDRPFTTAEQEGIEGYRIVYGSNLKGSRSGRAIMMESNTFPYLFPAIIRPTEKGSKNFLDDIYNSPSANREYKELMKAAVFRVFNRGRK